MKIKTSELIPPALDWAVEEAQGYGASYLKWWNEGGDKRFTHCEIMRAYSTNWGIAGPIIEREKISLHGANDWVAEHPDTPMAVPETGRTPLIAAMRAFVASKLGDEVDVPEELT